MTQRRRNRERGLLDPKPATLPEGVGRQPHPLDGHWPRAKTAADSTLLTEAEEVINDALSHADQRLTRKALTATEWDLFAKGFTLEQIEAGRAATINDSYDLARLTPAQRETVSMRLEGHSFRQIGALLGIHHSSAQERYRGGLAKLRVTPATFVVRTLREASNQ